jgi:hypothetical protein
MALLGGDPVLRLLESIAESYGVLFLWKKHQCVIALGISSYLFPSKAPVVERLYLAIALDTILYSSSFLTPIIDEAAR